MATAMDVAREGARETVTLRQLADRARVELEEREGREAEARRAGRVLSLQRRLAAEFARIIPYALRDEFGPLPEASAVHVSDDDDATLVADGLTFTLMVHASADYLGVRRTCERCGLPVDVRVESLGHLGRLLGQPAAHSDCGETGDDS